MDRKPIDENFLRDFLKCVNCHGLSHRLKTFPCMHIICKPCFDELGSNGLPDQKLSCMVCGCPFTGSIGQTGEIFRTFLACLAVAVRNQPTNLTDRACGMCNTPFSVGGGDEIVDIPVDVMNNGTSNTASVTNHRSTNGQLDCSTSDLEGPDIIVHSVSAIITDFASKSKNQTIEVSSDALETQSDYQLSEEMDMSQLQSPSETSSYDTCDSDCHSDSEFHSIGTNIERIGVIHQASEFECVLVESHSELAQNSPEGTESECQLPSASLETLEHKHNPMENSPGAPQFESALHTDLWKRNDSTNLSEIRSKVPQSESVSRQVSVNTSEMEYQSTEDVPNKSQLEVISLEASLKALDMWRRND